MKELKEGQPIHPGARDPQPSALALVSVCVCPLPCAPKVWFSVLGPGNFRVRISGLFAKITVFYWISADFSGENLGEIYPKLGIGRLP